jgi:hypothetical protein
MATMETTTTMNTNMIQVIVIGIETAGHDLLAKKIQELGPGGGDEFIMVPADDIDQLDVYNFCKMCQVDKNWIMYGTITQSLGEIIIDLIDRAPENAKPYIVIPWCPGPCIDRGILRELMVHALENGCEVRSGRLNTLKRTI